MGIVFALAAALMLALSEVLIKRSYRDVSPSVTYFYDVVFGFIIWIPFAIFSGVDSSNLGQVFIVAFISALLSEAYYFYILSKGDLSFTGLILSTYPIYTVLFSILLFGEKLSSTQLVFVTLTLIGVFVISRNSVQTFKGLNRYSIILWAISGALAVGFADSLANNIIDQSSSASLLLALAIVQLPVGLAFLKLENNLNANIFSTYVEWEIYKYSIFGSMFNVLGVMFLFLAFQYTLASFASPITSTHPVILLVLARVFLKERIPKGNYLGIFLVIMGVIGISYFM